MCDDLGFSDLGSYGGEMETPHIDRLASEGIRFTRFTNTGRCCPSRASLLTGRYHHTVEMGWMTAVDEHRPGYRGQLTEAVPTIAEIFKDHGYRTYMSGKWHVTLDGNYRNNPEARPNGSWPRDRGFDEFYGGLSGGGGYYEVRSLHRNETRITDFPDDYYYTTAITENALQFIETHDASEPMFLYLAHYAPHRPIEAPEHRIPKFRERYAVGYDVLRQERFDRLKKMGILNVDASLPPHDTDITGGRPPWESLTDGQKKAWVEEMATYAAMVEIMDDGIGEVVEALKEKGMYDNTLILFLSDNGATHEKDDISRWAASLSNTPYRMYKQFVHFGGIKSPLIIHYPKRFSGENGSLRHEFSHIIDLLPTCLDIAGIEYPEHFRGHAIPPMDGISLLPALENKPLSDRALYFEHQTACAIISEPWKLVRLKQDLPWELYKLDQDPFEETDLSGNNQEKAAQLEENWTQWAAGNNVFPLESRPWRERINYYTERNPDQDGID